MTVLRVLDLLRSTGIGIVWGLWVLLVWIAYADAYPTAPTLLLVLLVAMTATLAAAVVLRPLSTHVDDATTDDAASVTVGVWTPDEHGEPTRGTADRHGDALTGPTPSADATARRSGVDRGRSGAAVRPQRRTGPRPSAAPAARAAAGGAVQIAAVGSPEATAGRRPHILGANPTPQVGICTHQLVEPTQSQPEGPQDGKSYTPDTEAPTRE